MRAFLAACAAVILIGLVAQFVLDHFVQQPVSAAFATSEARVTH
jgi:hypothetical protein